MMTLDDILSAIAAGRTDLVFDLFDHPDGARRASEGGVSALQWFVYYGDVTALRAAVAKLGGAGGLDLGRELGNAAFFGHWKMADYLIGLGADPNWVEPATRETPLHSALVKAGRPYYGYVVRLLLEKGADPNAATVAGAETGAFMRDVRT